MFTTSKVRRLLLCSTIHYGFDIIIVQLWRGLLTKFISINYLQSKRMHVCSTVHREICARSHKGELLISNNLIVCFRNYERNVLMYFLAGSCSQKRLRRVAHVSDPLSLITLISSYKLMSISTSEHFPPRPTHSRARLIFTHRSLLWSQAQRNEEPWEPRGACVKPIYHIPVIFAGWLCQTHSTQRVDNLQVLE